MLNTFWLFLFTAFFEIFGCYAVLNLTRTDNTFAGVGYMISGLGSLIVFALLLSYHPTDSGRIYATYGGVYIFASLLWLLGVDKVTPTNSDIVGAVLAIVGALVIASQLFDGGLKS